MRSPRAAPPPPPTGPRPGRHDATRCGIHEAWQGQERLARGLAQLMGHANIDVTLNVYTQVLDGSAREAVEIGGGFVHEVE